MESLKRKRMMHLLVMSLLCMHCESMLYQEPLDMQDVVDIFNDYECIEGSLSVTETGSPFISSFAMEDETTVTKNVTEIPKLSGGKSPLSLINELASYNKIQYVYNLTEEQGPSHQKKFGVFLVLGEEKYFGEGGSIKKAQIVAANLALNSTSYVHPPQKHKADKPTKNSKNPIDRLDSWANKRNIIITYIYNEHSVKKHSNNYHENMYSKSENIITATVIIGEYKFSGEGARIEDAKQNAARNALVELQNKEGFCMFNNENKNIIDTLFNSDFENNSPVALVYEFSSKSRMPASFSLISEEGPAHIKNFVYKCNVGDEYETTGEGSSKKDAKRDAAQKMIKNLKSLIPFNNDECKNFVKTKKNNKKRSNLIKNVQIISDDEEEPRSHIPDNIDPISKLMQIQQSKRGVIPTFSLKEESGQNTKEFFIEVVIEDLSYIGSGPNKKTAKRKAAEGMLELLGYSTVDGKTRSHSTDRKKKAFRGSTKGFKRKHIYSGLNVGSINFNSDDFSLPENQPQTKQPEPDRAIDSRDSLSSTNHKNKKDTGHVNILKEFVNYAESMGFKFQFSDFPKKKDSGFISLLSMTTSPPRVCYGTGITTDISQIQAARNALENLYKNRLDSISNILREQSSDPIKDPQYSVDEKAIINQIINLETE